MAVAVKPMGIPVLRAHMNNNLCFVLMPFGKKADSTGRVIDFDAIYQQIIAPAVSKAGLEPIRADEETSGGIIHKPMFERLILCAYAVADLTIANPNVLYELGIRHAVRPWRTVTLFADGTRLPFDVNYLRSLAYKLDDTGRPVEAEADIERLLKALEKARAEAASPSVDSPVFQLVDYLPRPTIDHEKTDLFREQVRYSAEAKAQLAAARKTRSHEQIERVLEKLRPLGELDAAVVIDAMLSFRAVTAWPEMVKFIEDIPKELRATVMVREQLAFALNRASRSDDAEKILLDLIEERGPSSETLGILGRVYKDRWQSALEAGSFEEAAGHLERAIDAYVRGFESDWRDAYPGVNALTLIAIRDSADPRFAELFPVVRYAVTRKLMRRPDYWDHATIVELEVLARDEAKARSALGRALACVREPWEPETTARNLALIREARRRRRETTSWANEIEKALWSKAGKEPPRMECDG